MRARLTNLRLAKLVALVVLGIVVFGNGYGHFHTDIKPEVYVSPDRMLPQYLSAWSTTPSLGAPNFNVGLVPVLVWTALLRAIGLSPEMTFKVFHFILWVLGAWGASRLLRELSPKVSPWAAFATAVVFLANPYTVTGGSTLAIALPMCLLPWMLLAFARALKQPAGWVWPVVVSLVFFSMSGMNVAVVPIYQLLMAIPVMLVLRRQLALGWASVAAVVAKCALFVTGVSLYWLIPSFAARGAGAQVIEGSESLEGIAKVSSFLEVLRGLGMWTLYGRSDSGAWMPEYAMYITVGAIVVVTVLWPAMSLISLRWTSPPLTRVAVGCIAMAAVILVGVFPGDGALSPAGMVLGWIFENVPGALAFRTTNKIGAVLTLAFALVLGVGVDHIASRVRPVPGLRQVSFATAFALVAVWSVPALSGSLYTSEFDVPDYWHKAAQEVNEASDKGRVLFLPGQPRSHYRWSEERPDDVSNSLIERDAIIPETTTNTSAGAHNLLSAMDDTLQTQTEVDAALSTYARYLGVNQILLRHDIVWEDVGGARPGDTARVLAQDPGLFGRSNFGATGQYILPPGIAPQDYTEATLRPLQLYDVRDPVPQTRVTPTTGQVLIAGDGWSIPPLTREGLLDETPLLRYVGAMEEDQFASALDTAGRIVLTDTNRRREAVTNRLISGNGPLLEADESTELMRSLGTESDQTVLRRSGVEVTASDEGAAFFTIPSAVAENALDGHDSTAWLFGDFRRAPGTTLDVDLGTARTLDEVVISQADVGPVKIDEVTLTAGEKSVTRSFPDSGDLTVDLGGVSVSDVTLHVDSVRGEGFNLVGISEIDLGVGAVAHRTARLPRSIDEAYSALTPEQRQSFADVPLDVYLTRVTNAPTPRDDSEVEMRRDFTLPDGRTFRAEAQIRLDGAWEEVADELHGLEGASFRSSDVYFNNPDARASRAADGDPDSAWVPGGDLKGAWWQATAPEETTFDSVSLVQEPGFGDEDLGTRYASRVEVFVDGDRVGSGDVGAGESTVILDEPVTGRTVRVQIEKTSEPDGASARFTAIDTGLRAREPDDQNQQCMTVAELDGDPVRMRPKDVDDLKVTEGTPWEACGDDPQLAWGEHELRPAPGVTIDSMSLRDVQGLQDASSPPAPTAQINREPGGGATISTGSSGRPYALVLGQAFDPRWEATMDGEDLGPPVRLNGYSVGWVIEDSDRPHEFEISFGPQRWSTFALLTTTTFLLICVAVLAVAWWSRRQGSGESEPTEAFTDEVDDLTAVRPTSATSDEVAPAEGRSWFRRHRGGIELATVLACGFFVGWAGVVGAVLAIGLVRWRGLRPARLIDIGAALLLVSAVVFVLGPGDTGGRVSADAIADSLWPHRIAGAGLTIALLGAMWRTTPLLNRPDSQESHDPA